MKLRKNINMNSVVARLEQLQQEAAVLVKNFRDIMQLFDNTKLGISELNYNMEEDLGRFHQTYSKIDELIRSL